MWWLNHRVFLKYKSTFLNYNMQLFHSIQFIIRNWSLEVNKFGILTK